MCPVAGLSKAEALLVAAASSVLVAAVATVPFLYDDSGPSSSAPAPTAAPSPTASPVVLAVSQVRVTTYARGSHQLVVRARVSTGASAALLVGGTSYPLHLVAGEASGTVPVTCGGAVPELTLVVQTADGVRLTASLGRPTGPFAQACATPRPGAPVPTGTPLSS
jgi:hypothetical protein